MATVDVGTICSVDVKEKGSITAQVGLTVCNIYAPMFISSVQY